MKASVEAQFSYCQLLNRNINHLNQRLLWIAATVHSFYELLQKYHFYYLPYKFSTFGYWIT